MDHFVGIEFHRFKAFRSFSIAIRKLNILVGPNNAGKSTVLASFRILAAALRRANLRKPEIVQGPSGGVLGHKINLAALSVAEENIFFDYERDEPAWVRFKLSNGNTLTLYFPEPQVCYLIPDAQGRSYGSPASFKKLFRCPIGFVPILAPVDHREFLYEPEAAKRALSNYGAARNFRNIWHHFPDAFGEFRELLKRTWPGMDVTPPELDYSHERTVLHMWCPEGRIPREIFWAGFGFQVWCQMLTYLLHAKNVSLFLIDEPDIYLHADLQRQLLGILRKLGPDILVATHSTEILTEADADEVVLVDKGRTRAKRLKNTMQLESVFRSLGSAINPILTQLAKTRKVVFVEGTDFHLLGRFARRMERQRLANRSDFAVVPLEGFNPDRIRTLRRGIEATLGVDVSAAAILDRDYRPAEERASVIDLCGNFCKFATVHECKELENFVLVPEAIDRAVRAKLADRKRRGLQVTDYRNEAAELLDAFAKEKFEYVVDQHLRSRKSYERNSGRKVDESELAKSVRAELVELWRDPATRLRLIPGKDALTYVNNCIQDRYGVNVTASAVIEAMHIAEIPEEMVILINNLEKFALDV
ncbi:ATP-dependent nuclease [Rhizorhabdus phycosphaerae]|uniref:ATP-dependent nuclease n=1 Tax=Rhizorhabdus phycosphaerae TaxID=2711156 RepID=UPI0019CFAAAC|nr:AAA family ATPase [Rhizorhabdus phycosphaerae]